MNLSAPTTPNPQSGQENTPAEKGPAVAAARPNMAGALVLLAGPTAAGKSAIAMALAERLGGEIVAVDSMQVYRGLDIGTAKPIRAERDRIPHHLVDILDLSETFDAAQFVQRAQAAVAEIHQRGRVAILCGGTGLYFKAFLEGLSGVPAMNWALRRELEATPLEALLAELRERDPATYEQVDRRNPRRVVRAVEVLRMTGKSFWGQRARWGSGGASSGHQGPVSFFCFSRKADDLRRRIEARVERMFDLGLVGETKTLLARGLEQNQAAMQALGYRQVVEHLRGVRSLEDTVRVIKTRTWQYARRQMTWFRRQAQPEWIELEPGQEGLGALGRLTLP
jgi:tRNA dimethylallyltransferase